mgnify:CR=1 FL=1
MRTFKYLAVLLVLALFSAEVAQAQRFTSKKRYWSLGVTLNAMNYMGDIVPKDAPASFDLGFTRPTIGVTLERRILPMMTVRAGLTYGTLSGDDYTSVIRAFGSVEAAMQDPSARFRLYRNLHFRNRIAELSAVATIDLRQNRGFFYQRPSGFTPYLMFGVAATYSNPQAKPEEDIPWVDLRPLETEGESYGSIVLSFPLGFGVKYKLNDRIDIGAEIGVRITTTDRLDDVSGRYPDRTDMGEDAAYFAFRGNETVSAFGGEDRSGIISAMQDHYGVGSPGAVEAIFAFPGDENRAGERRGNDGTLYEDSDQRKLGLLSGANDIYLVYGFKLNYIMGGGVSCPKFR